MTDTDNQPPSKRAREAAANAYRTLNFSPSFVGRVRRGQEGSRLVQAFAQFERTLLDEIKARVRGLREWRPGQSAWKAAIDEALTAIDTIQGRE